MLTSILGARLSWHFANGWVFEPAIVGPDIVDYTLKEGPHAGRHAIQHFYYERVAPGVETTVWYEESGALVHITWYLETQTTHRFAALPAWLGEDMSVYRGDNQDPAFIEKIRKLSSENQDFPRKILNGGGSCGGLCRPRPRPPPPSSEPHWGGGGVVGLNRSYKPFQPKQRPSIR